MALTRIELATSLRKRGSKPPTITNLSQSQKMVVLGFEPRTKPTFVRA